MKRILSTKNSGILAGVMLFMLGSCGHNPVSDANTYADKFCEIKKLEKTTEGQAYGTETEKLERLKREFEDVERDMHERYATDTAGMRVFIRQSSARIQECLTESSNK